MPRHSLTILCLLLASTAPVLPESVRAASRARALAESQDEIVRYKVKAGDDLVALASAHFIDPEDWRKAKALNGLATDKPLVAGSVLLVRQSWLKAAPIKAEIAAFRGAVSIHSSEQKMAARVGQKLDEGDLLETGANGFITLRLPDASLIALPSNSRIRLSRLRAVSLTQSVDRRFSLESGRSEARVTPMANPASKFIITTPVAVAAVRGTEYRVSFTPATMTARAEVIEGKVLVGAGGEPVDKAAEVLLLPDFGTVATLAGVRQPIALLAAPELDQPAKLQSKSDVTFRLKPVKGATAYVVDLATDAGFVDRIASTESIKAEVSFADVPDGSLHVRVAARDVNGLTGRPASFAFERRLAAAPAAPASSDAGGSRGAGVGAGPKPASRRLSAAAAVLPDASKWAGLKLETSRSLNESKQEADAEAEAESVAATLETEEGDAAYDEDSVGTNGPTALSSFRAESGGGGGGGGSGLFVPGKAGGQGAGNSQAPLFPLPPAITVPDPFQPVVVPPFLVPPASLVPLAPVAPLLPAGPVGPASPVTSPAVVVPALVPEPASWALLISGFGLIGLALRRRHVRKA